MTHSIVDQPLSDHTLPMLDQPQIAKNIAQAETLCRAKRARMTPIRKRVLEALHASGRPLGAYDLASVIAPQGRRIAPITVYRALDFLIEQGLAYRLASLNAYVAGSQVSREHTVTAFLICENCGNVSEVFSSELSDTVSKLQKSHAFVPHARVLEITGHCAHC